MSDYLPTVSVLLPIYKEPYHWIQASIESILCQTFTKFELLLLVDNPADQILHAFLQKYLSDARIRLLISKKNIGLPRTLNKGIELSKGEYIARMDADDIAFPSRLQQQYAYIRSNPSIDLCGCQVLKIDENGNSIKPSYDPIEPKLLRSNIKYINIITHPTWFIKRSTYMEMGGYRNFPNAEDYDLVYRMIDAGKQIGIVDEILLSWRIHLNGQTGGKSLEQKICFQYVQELHEERLLTGKDGFNEAIVLKRIKANRAKYGSQQKKAQYFLLQTFMKKKEKRYFKAIFYFILSFFASPIQRKYYLSLFFSKVVILRHKLFRNGV